MMECWNIGIVGFMDFAVHERPAESGLPHGLDSFWWGGAFGTWFWIDPTNDIVFVGMGEQTGNSGSQERRLSGQKPTFRLVAGPTSKQPDCASARVLRVESTGTCFDSRRSKCRRACQRRPNQWG